MNSTEMISNDQINENLSKMVWTLVEECIREGRLFFTVKIEADIYRKIKDRMWTIKQYINNIYLNNSGLSVSNCWAYRYHTIPSSVYSPQSSHHIAVIVKEGKIMSSPPPYTDVEDITRRLNSSRIH